MLDFVRDLYSSFRQTSLERVKSPFLGAFVFSWLAFNWQALAILFFSERKIEEKIKHINENYDVASLLVAPIFTSVLIAFFLPQINKLITKIQDKPNSDTIELTLSSKIKVAKLQQSIAEHEARKRLADKKEERNIEENIESIKNENSKLNDAIVLNELQIKELTEDLNTSKINENNHKAKMNSAIETRDKMEKDLRNISEANKELNTTIRSLREQINKTEVSLTAMQRDADWLNKEKIRLDEIVQKYYIQVTELNNNYSAIFKGNIIDGIPQLELSDQAKKVLKEVDAKLTRGILDSILNNNKY